MISRSPFVAVTGVNLDIQPGEICGLTGPNGSGKSTLFDCCTGLQKPDAGQVYARGLDITGWEMHRIVREAGVIRGFRKAVVFRALSVEQNLVLCGQLVSFLPSFDMGGTTAKLCMLLDGEPRIAPELEVAHAARFRTGSGLPLKIQSVRMIEIDAGGGSIASVGALGLMAVGPRNAGAAPGPACYGLGGEQPTVTDTDLLQQRNFGIERRSLPRVGELADR